MTMKSRFRRVTYGGLIAGFLASVFLMVAGCGGGGDSGSKTETDDQSPSSEEKTTTPERIDSGPSDADLIFDDASSSGTDKGEASGTAQSNSGAPVKEIGPDVFVLRDRATKAIRLRYGRKRFSNFTRENPPEGSWVYHGSYEEYYSGGLQLLCKGSYVDGEHHGKWTFWHPNGQIAKEGHYDHGKLSGKWTYWTENGKVKNVESYAGGVEDGDWLDYWEDGQTVVRQRQYKAGEPHGTWTTWYEPGKKAVEVHYKNGLMDGEFIEWFQDGQMKSQSYFKDGKRHGIARSWDSKGTEMEAQHYEEGHRVRKPAG